MPNVNPTNISAYYHYAIFLYEVKNEKVEAVKTLKQKHKEIIDRLGHAYEYYIDSYEMLETLTESLTNWVVNLTEDELQQLDDEFDNDNNEIIIDTDNQY